MLPAAASPDAVNVLLDTIDAQLPRELQKSNSFLRMDDQLVTMQRTMTDDRIAHSNHATPDLDLPVSDAKQLLALMQSDVSRTASIIDMMYGEMAERVFGVHADTMELMCHSPSGWSDLTPAHMLQLQRYACDQAYHSSLSVLESVVRGPALAFKKSFVMWRVWSVLLESSLRLGKHADLQAACAALRLYADQWCLKHVDDDDAATSRIVRATVESAVHAALGRACAVESKWSQAHSHFQRALEAQRRQIHTDTPADFDEAVTDAVECMLYGGSGTQSDPMEFEMRLLNSAAHAALKRGAPFLPVAVGCALESIKLAHMDPREPQWHRLDAAVKLMEDDGSDIAALLSKRPSSAAAAAAAAAAEGSTTLPPGLRALVDSSFARALPVLFSLVSCMDVLCFDLSRAAVDCTLDPSRPRRAERMWSLQRRGATMAAAYQQMGRILDTVPTEAAQRIHALSREQAATHTSGSGRAAAAAAAASSALPSAAGLSAASFAAAVRLAAASAPTAQFLEQFVRDAINSEQEPHAQQPQPSNSQGSASNN